jgi:hypothetical protein
MLALTVRLYQKYRTLNLAEIYALAREEGEGLKPNAPDDGKDV